MAPVAFRRSVESCIEGASVGAGARRRNLVRRQHHANMPLLQAADDGFEIGLHEARFNGLEVVVGAKFESRKGVCRPAR